MVRKVIERERPDALLPTMGGQTALNIARSLARDGTLAEFGVQLIGADLAAIEKAEDRQQFQAAMNAIGPDTPRPAPKRVVSGKSVSVRVDPGGRRRIKKK